MTTPLNSEFKKSLIKKQTCFSELTENEIQELSLLFIETPFAAGETIVTESDPVDSVYLIVSGTAEVRHISIENNKPQVQLLAILNAGDAIGLNESGFYSLSGRRTATVVAQSDMLLLRLSVAAFHGFALMNSHVNEIMRKIADSLYETKQ
jgi:CRP-like cAMP-binding protein